ncbi:MULTISPECIES: DUF4258 domain-containing protein [Planktothrix]|uniref:DUF4258 domain-containing protein n=1 Tax=Planktothrix TaxID=54304 RepID=UPI002277265D|nr:MULTISPECIES: DUF4258 domain-containing protein [Planktothrix]
MTEHARYQILKRKILESWIEQTLLYPERVELLADIHGNTHYLKRIQEFGDRWLRVVVNPNVEPNRVVTIFFDRRVK